jgi:hypothetical protein
MKEINIPEISHSPLILEFTQEIFEGFYHVKFEVPKRQIIDTKLLPRVTPKSFKRSMMENLKGETEPIAGQKIYYVEGKPRAINGLLKIQNMLNDPSVSTIECQGPNTPLILVRRGMKQFTRLSLTQEEIKDILDDFTEKAHIPLVDGVIHVVVDNFEITGVYSELIRSNFSISRV